MSRIGKQPIAIPDKTKVTVNGQVVLVEGPKGKLDLTVPKPITVQVKDGKVLVDAQKRDRDGKARWGLTRSLINNMIGGVTKGYTKRLLIEGVGFRAAVQGKMLQLQIGYSHPINYTIPPTIKLTVTDTPDKKPLITIEGVDKQLVGEVTACIRRFYPPEPYKGKGIRIEGEHVRRKAGKTVTSGG